MDECFHKTKCGQPFLLLKDSEHNVTAEAYIGNNKLFGDLDQTVRESHKISDQVSTILLLFVMGKGSPLFWDTDNCLFFIICNISATLSAGKLNFAMLCHCQECFKPVLNRIIIGVPSGLMEYPDER